MLLSRYSGEEDVVFGGVVSGRPAALPGVETMVGMFINTLPVRVRVDDAEPLAAWLQRLQARQLARQELRAHPAVRDPALERGARRLAAVRDALRVRELSRCRRRTGFRRPADRQPAQLREHQLSRSP